MMLRALSSDLDRLTGLLARGDRADVQAARRVVAALRRALTGRRAERVELAEQLALRLRYQSDSAIDCPLGCPVRAVVCVARQIQSEWESSGRLTVFARSSRSRLREGRAPELARHDRKRGVGLSRPTCVTARCEVGAAARVGLGDTEEAVAMAARAPRASDTSEA